MWFGEMQGRSLASKVFRNKELRADRDFSTPPADLANSESAGFVQDDGSMADAKRRIPLLRFLCWRGLLDVVDDENLGWSRFRLQFQAELLLNRGEER